MLPTGSSVGSCGPVGGVNPILKLSAGRFGIIAAVPHPELAQAGKFPRVALVRGCGGGGHIVCPNLVSTEGL